MWRVFRRTSNSALALLISLVVFFAAYWFTNTPFLFQLLSDQSVGAPEAMRQTLVALFSVFADLPLYELLYGTMLSLLVGINATLMIFYFRMYRVIGNAKDLQGGLLGSLSALLGFGCAACGAVFLTSILASVGGAGLLTLLPLGGKEFGFLAGVLLLISIRTLARAINRPPICPI